MRCWRCNQFGVACRDRHTVEGDRSEQRAGQLLEFAFRIERLVVLHGVVAVAGLYFQVRAADDADPDLAEFAPVTTLPVLSVTTASRTTLRVVALKRGAV